MADSSGERRDDPRLVVGVMVGAVVAFAVWGAGRVWHEVRKHRA